MIAIVDYGLGNVQAIANIYKRLDLPAALVRTAAELSAATRIILPGVGAFDWAMQRLNDSGMRETLDRKVTAEATPVLGICVGMQMLASGSEEGRLPGLGWIPGSVRRFDAASVAAGTPLPHMGWNDVEPVSRDGLFQEFSDARFYFLHSYFLGAAEPADVLARTHYGGEFASAVRRGNVYGVQFHPEKSHAWGVQLLRNFAGI